MSTTTENYAGETAAQAAERRKQEEHDNPGHTAARRAIETHSNVGPDTAEQLRDQPTDRTQAQILQQDPSRKPAGFTRISTLAAIATLALAAIVGLAIAHAATATEIQPATIGTAAATGAGLNVASMTGAFTLRMSAYSMQPGNTATVCVESTTNAWSATQQVWCNQFTGPITDHTERTITSAELPDTINSTWGKSNGQLRATLQTLYGANGATGIGFRVWIEQ